MRVGGGDWHSNMAFFGVLCVCVSASWMEFLAELLLCECGGVGWCEMG